MFGVSESRISQILAGVRRKLQAALADYDSPQSPRSSLHAPIPPPRKTPRAAGSSSFCGHVRSGHDRGQTPDMALFWRWPSRGVGSGKPPDMSIFLATDMDSPAVA